MKEIRFCGSGGQGIITMAIILAETLTEQGQQVVQTQTYGPEAWGGTCQADIITDQYKIYYPKVQKPDILLAMNQEACDKYVKDLDDDGILIIDSTFVTDIPQGAKKVYAVPITKMTREQVGNPIYSNMVALGFLARVSNLVDHQGLIDVVVRKLPEQAKEKNIQALELGWNM